MKLLDNRSDYLAPESATQGAAREFALRAVAGLKVRTAPVVRYESKGSVAIIGPEQQALSVAERLGPSVESLVLATGPKDKDPGAPKPDPALPRPVLASGRLAAIVGHLGCFQAQFQAGNRTVGLLDLTAGSRETVDLVLDLGQPPLIRSELLPPGYFAPSGDPEALEAALAQIPELVGQFEKPQFFVYDPSICAHSRSGVQACTRCIDACPADAIESNGDQGIRVDAHRCQGAGSCASACPSGAIRYGYPPLGDSLEHLATLLKSYREAGGERPILLFHDEEGGAERLAKVSEPLPGNVLPVEVPELGSVGMDQWLAALAFGATRLVLLGSTGLPAPVAAELATQMTVARALLNGMGYPEDALALLIDPTDEQLLSYLRRSELELQINGTAFACLDDKRAVLRLALDHLYRQAPTPRPLITLPAGAAFGEVSLLESRCTLCMACVSQCPGKALMEGGELPQLKFVEDNCIQCGMCARVCPENAIAPSPRYLFEGVERRKVHLLKEEPPYLCVRCGKPFATQSVIRKITHRLSGHPNFGPRELARLEMCEDCRVRSLFEEELAQQAEVGREVRR